jgi:2-methylcitrate dehydratase PrpD
MSDIDYLAERQRLKQLQAMHDRIGCICTSHRQKRYSLERCVGELCSMEDGPEKEKIIEERIHNNERLYEQEVKYKREEAAEFSRFIDAAFEDVVKVRFGKLMQENQEIKQRIKELEELEGRK